MLEKANEYIRRNHIDGKIIIPCDTGNRMDE